MGLSREVLRWILSLDLSLAVRNPRRDFSNGYLVAEILSKHWDDVSMHSYVNATSTAEKRSNWDLLTKFFHLHGINLTSETVDSIVSQQQAAVERFLQQLYLFVNERSPPQASMDRAHPPASSMLPASESGPSRQSSVASRHSPWSSGIVPDDPPVPPVPSQSQIHAMMQNQLAQMAPLQQQDIIANVMAQRAVFVQALMAGKNPEEAMAAAIELLPNTPPSQQEQHIADRTSAAVPARPQPVVSMSGQAAVPPSSYTAGRLGNRAGEAAPEHECTSHQPQGHAHRRAQAEASCSPKPHDRSSSGHSPHSSYCHTQVHHSMGDFAPRTIRDWKESANNPKAETYRYWELGSLGPAETEELASKRLAALRAKEYGIRVAELAKTTLKPKAKPESSRIPSTRDRAMEFAKTVRAPKPVSKPDVPKAKPPDAGGRTQRGRPNLRSSVKRSSAANEAQARQLQHQLSVDTMVARHMDAAKRVENIKAEVERWDLEDKQLPAIPQMPKRRSPSPPRARNTSKPKEPSESSQHRKPAAPGLVKPPPAKPAPDPTPAYLSSHDDYNKQTNVDTEGHAPATGHVDADANLVEQSAPSEDERSNA
eukprot:jgi/Ulvmu1/10372/UM061_0055.1